MKNLVIASGKGGTGKTTVAVNLALALATEDLQVQLLDCDVEEPNAHLFLKPELHKTRIVGIPVPEIDLSKCNFCGYCAEVCSFKALAVFTDQVMVLPELCHGCGSCAYLCPEKAIKEVDRPIGVVESGQAGDILFSHGKLNPGEAMSPPLIDEVKKEARPGVLTIIDAPPGTSCPVVTSMGEADYCLLVTEPTPFGLNDLDLAFQLTQKLKIPAGVVLNRCDLGDGAVERYCLENNLPVVMKIPFDRQVAELYARGEIAAAVLPKWRDLFTQMFARLKTEQQGAV